MRCSVCRQGIRKNSEGYWHPEEGDHFALVDWQFEAEQLRRDLDTCEAYLACLTGSKSDMAFQDAYRGGQIYLASKKARR